MAAPRYPRSAFLSPRLTAARRWAAVTGAGLALPLLVAGTAAAAGPDTPPGEGRTVEPAVQQAPARISADLPAVPVTPVLPELPQLPQVPVPSAVTAQPSTPVPTDPGETCPPSGEPTRATPLPSPSPSPSPSADPSDAAEPSPSVPASPSASVSPTAPTSTAATASPSASPAPTAAAGRTPPAHGGERGIRHQPAPAAALPEEPELVVPAEPTDGWDEEAGDALPPMAGPDDPSPSAPVTAAAGAARPQAAAQAQADAALPLHWTDPSTLQLPLGAGLTLIGFGLALVGFRLRRR
ncbi:hypothetical protein ACGFX4_21000 [Kitasatospora sp. NPDC048365]|uniref:hypothetical protein n=1 Tax=Kitasatospora sp. NPDC048365 TaxID=3364050 RepID=UPI00372344DA